MSTGKDTPVPMIEDPRADYEQGGEESIEVIADRYVVKELLGQGGMGRVFRAHDNLLDRDVAVKLLNRELRDDYFVRRFQQEARAASQLKHTNILCVLDFGLVSQTQPYLIMEWVDGATLDQVMDRDGKFTISHAVEICIKLAEGMQHAHRNGIIHRDLKPSNIMLSQTEIGERVLILDFGIAKMVDDPTERGMLTMTGQIIGSPRCISPEQARGEQLDGRSDIYSLGCVMFELFAGRPPYRGENAISTIAMHLNEPIPTISEGSDAKFPDGLEEIISKTMAKDPQDRFASMEELREKLALLDFASLQEIETKESDRPEPVKTPGIIFDTRVVLALGCLIVFTIGYFTFQSNQHQVDSAKIAFNGPQKPDDQLESTSVHASNLTLSDESVVDKEVDRQVGKVRNLSPEKMVTVNEAKSGEDLQTQLEAKPDAIHLSLYGLTITPDMVAVIEKRGKLTKLRLQSCIMPSELQTRICKIKRLTALKFVDMTVSSAEIKQLKKLPALIDFQAYKTNLKDDALTEIAALRNLETLEINENQHDFAPGATQKLSALKKLKVLQLRSNGITDSDLQWISTLQNLNTLGLSGNGPFTPAGLKQLVKLENLIILYLDKTNLNDKCLLSVAKIPNLITIDTSNNSDITIGGLQHLRGRPDLQVVVTKTGIDPNSIRRLATELNIKLFESRPRSTSSNNAMMEILLPND
ncbi:MAG: protein kinase [Candidatus Melainabacteria bacterium]|nr:protein kinase [Candidatus Melainabacteria bacterium]